MLDKPQILSPNSSDKFNNTGALMLDSIYHMMLKSFCNCALGINRLDFYVTLLWHAYDQLLNCWFNKEFDQHPSEHQRGHQKLLKGKQTLYFLTFWIKINF